LLDTAGLNGDEAGCTGRKPRAAVVVAGTAEQIVGLEVHAGEVDREAVRIFHAVRPPERSIDRRVDAIHRNDGQLRGSVGATHADDRPGNATGAGCECFAARDRHAVGIHRCDVDAVSGLRVPDPEEATVSDVVLGA